MLFSLRLAVKESIEVYLLNHEVYFMTHFFTLFRAYFPHISRPWQLAVLLFCVLVFALRFCTGKRSRGGRLGRAAFSALLSYVFLLLVMLVLSRSGRSEPSAILDPFYSYRKIFAFTPGSFEWLCLDVFNCLLYLPLGVFFAAWRQSGDIDEKGRGTLWRAAARGFALSLLIETLQYLLRRGVFELDDLLHNTLGTLLGALLWQGGAALASQIQRRRDP